MTKTSVHAIRPLWAVIAAALIALFVLAPLAKADDDSITNVTATNISNNGATITASIYPLGGLDSQADVYYGTTPNPDGSWQATPKTDLGNPNAWVPYSQPVLGVAPATKVYYQVRSFQQQQWDHSVWAESDSPVQSFTTAASAPVIAPGSAFAGVIDRTSVTLLAQVNGGGSPTTYHWLYGTVPGIYSMQTPDQALPGGSGSQTAQTPVSDLTPGGSYYAKLVATNAAGSSQSNEISFSTPAVLAPSFRSFVAYSMAPTTGSAVIVFDTNGAPTTCSAQIVPDASFQTTGFNGAQTVACVPPTQSAGSNLSAQIEFSGLNPKTVYDVRGVLTNSAGTTTFDGGRFTTTGAAPVIGNVAVSDINRSGGTVTATVNDDGQQAGVGMEYGPTNSYGSATSGIQLAASENDQPVSFTIGNQSAGSPVLFRIAADTPQQSSEVTGSFTTLPAPTAPAPTRGAPLAVILSGPRSDTSDTSASFGFDGENVDSYQCLLDQGAWEPCSSGQSYTVDAGWHEFRLQGFQTGGAASQVATSYWLVDAPKECVVKSARARALQYTQQNKIRLVYPYNSYRQAKNVQVTLYANLSAHRRLQVGSARLSLKKRGTVRIIKTLPKKVMAEIRRAGGSYTAQLHIPQTSAAQCNQFLTKKLTVKRTVDGQDVYFPEDVLQYPGGVNAWLKD